LCVANVDVLDLGLIENSHDCSLGRSVIYLFAHGHPTIADVSFEHQRKRAKSVGEFILRGYVAHGVSWTKMGPGDGYGSSPSNGLKVNRIRFSLPTSNVHRH